MILFLDKGAYPVFGEPSGLSLGRPWVSHDTMPDTFSKEYLQPAKDEQQCDGIISCRRSEFCTGACNPSGL
jgi:hypothetical protein